ncbi:MAG: SUMF1/EgtB/PvdO family nonheme iron enzyme [Muribaculaceae bacterium]|nr:SUMF1/EgtB/PvdO family nonheme iron enzyme [Muribaculaceae bacterium]
MKTRRMLKIISALAALLIPAGLQAINLIHIFPHGDSDHSKSVNINDVTAMIDHMLRGYSNISDDMDGDMKVDINDVTVLIDYLLGGQWNWGYTGPTVPSEALEIEVNGVKFAMLPVEGGTYRGYDLQDFYMGQTEVTCALWEAVMGSPSHTIISQYDQSPWQPVDMTSWWGCQDFIAKLNELTGLEFHLPTICQWRYAASGGNKSQGYRYAGSDNLDEVAWYSDNEPSIYNHFGTGVVCYTVPVGLKKPNELGLYDMNGNVCEWVYDSPGYAQGDYLVPLDDIIHNQFQKVRMGGSTWESDSNNNSFSPATTGRSEPSNTALVGFVGLRLALQAPVADK